MRPFITIPAFLAACLLLVACSTNPATNRRQFILLSSEEVSQLGEEAKPELIREYGGEVPQAELREYVRRIGAAMAATTEGDYPSTNWEFIVLNSDVINAFALPGGKVFVSRGLMHYMTNEAQLAAVIGHEIGHVTARHVDERISQAISAEIGLAVLGAMTESQLAVLGAQLVTGGYQLKFGRDQEREADRLGIRYMSNVNYDPQGMAQLLQILIDTSGGAAQPEFLSTHPNPERRRREAMELIESEYAHTQNNAEFGLFQQAFERYARPHLPPPRQVAGRLRFRSDTDGADDGVAEAAFLPPSMWCLHCLSIELPEEVDTPTE